MNLLRIIIIFILCFVLVNVVRNYDHICSSIAVTNLYLNQPKGYNFQIENYSSSLGSTYTQKIPLKIIQTAGSKNVDLSLYQCAQTNRHMNPEYEYMFFDDKACIDFIVENFPNLLQWYNKLRPGAYKADFFRLLILKKMGGVYLDIKTTCLVPLREMIPSDIEFMSIRDILKGSVYNGVIACVPEHPIINDTIRRYIDNIKNRNYGINPLDVGGPQTLGRAVNTYLGREELDDIPKGSINGIFITGQLRMMSKTETIFISDDEKTPLFNRTCSSYVSSKLKQALKGKEYHSLWIFKKVYSE